jgi:hypothetical protein
MSDKECSKAMAVADPAQRLAADVVLRTAVGLLRPR